MPDKLIPGESRSPVYKKGRAESSVFQMKGSPHKTGEIEGTEAHTKLIQDPDYDQGWQSTDETGVKQFASVQNLIDAGAPKSVITKKYNEEMDKWKAKNV